MIKVCHVGTKHRRYDTRIFHKECISLAKAGYDVTYLTPDDGQSEEIRNGVRILPVQGVPRTRFIKRFLKYNKIMLQKALELDADIYHLHEWEILPWAKELKKRGKKVIFDSHEDYLTEEATKHSTSLIQTKIAYWLCERCESYIPKYIDAVITPCTFRGKYLFEGICRKEIVISNAPKLEDFYCKFRNRESHSNDKAICYVGGLSYARGITHLIKAAYRANVKLVLAGSWSTEAYAEVVRCMPEFSCVDYRGFLQKDEVCELYSTCEIGMATLLNVGQNGTGDNFATKVYEYMSMGMPVIAGSYPYIDQQIKKYQFGITVNPSNVEEIANAIQYLIDNPTEARIMGENGRRAIKEEFNWEIEEKKLLGLYKDLCQKNG